MNIKNENELKKGIADYWTNKKQGVFYYLISKIRDKSIDEIEDVLSEISKKLNKSLSTGKYPQSKWDALLRIIRNGCRNDFYRKERVKKERIVEIKYKELEKISKEEKKIIDKEREKTFVFLRKILLTKHRSLQEAMLVFQAPTIKKLQEKLKNRFPFIANRTRRMGINFEFKRKNEAPFTKEGSKEIEEFSNLLLKLSNELKINDWMGREALKILLISEKPFFDLCIISNYPKEKDYRGKLIKAKTIKRPYSNFFRDYLAVISNIKSIKEFLKEFTEKYPDYPVNEEYAKKWFGIKKLDSGTINKQKFGRTGKPGFKEKIKRYDAVLQDNLNKI